MVQATLDVTPPLGPVGTRFVLDVRPAPSAPIPERLASRAAVSIVDGRGAGVYTGRLTMEFVTKGGIIYQLDTFGGAWCNCTAVLTIDGKRAAEVAFEVTAPSPPLSQGQLPFPPTSTPFLDLNPTTDDNGNTSYTIEDAAPAAVEQWMLAAWSAFGLQEICSRPVANDVGTVHVWQDRGGNYYAFMAAGGAPTTLIISDNNAWVHSLVTAQHC